MAPKKTKFKKKSEAIYLEPELTQFARDESLREGNCIHFNIGSASEHVRRGYKSFLLDKYPNIRLNKNLKHVDWDEAY